MEPSKAAMKAALRVLTALSEHQPPDQADVDELHWYAPADRERPVDELACDAIQRALQDRDETRKAIRRKRALVMSSADSASAPATGLPDRDREVDRLLRENARYRREYLDVCTRLKRLGVVLQHVAPNLLAADSGALSENSETSEAACRMLDSVAPEIDVSGIVQLLNEHVRLARALLAGQEALKAYGVQQHFLIEG